ncbi:MAG: hypothetical protein AAFQ63_22950 [Cyanobacteria bacterium J06621_11]
MILKQESDTRVRSHLLFVIASVSRLPFVSGAIAFVLCRFLQALFSNLCYR